MSTDIRKKWSEYSANLPKALPENIVTLVRIAFFDGARVGAISVGHRAADVGLDAERAIQDAMTPVVDRLIDRIEANDKEAIETVLRMLKEAPLPGAATSLGAR